jgi:hypothetical protein
MSIRFVRAAALSLSLLAAGTAQAEPAQSQPATAAPSAEAAPIDPARLDAATKSVEFIFPKGTYARMMDRTLNGMMKPMLDSFGKIPLRDLAEMTGADEERLKAIGDGKIDEVMQILDPAYKERLTVGMPMMFKAMQGMVDEFEPIMKGGLARAYSRRFDPGQLAELNTFFATPTGSAYASESMLIFTDPEVMSTMTAMVPMMMKRMPEIVKTMEAEMARFPKRRAIEELTPAERKTVNRLLGANGNAAPKD